MPVIKCAECDKEFKAKTEKEAFEKLKKHRKNKHLNKDEDNMSYIS